MIHVNQYIYAAFIVINIGFCIKPTSYFFLLCFGYCIKVYFWFRTFGYLGGFWESWIERLLILIWGTMLHLGIDYCQMKAFILIYVIDFHLLKSCILLLVQRVEENVKFKAEVPSCSKHEFSALYDKNLENDRDWKEFFAC